MAETVTCEDCGEEMDSRGLPGHKRMVHGENGNGPDSVPELEAKAEADQEAGEGEQGTDAITMVVAAVLLFYLWNL